MHILLIYHSQNTFCYKTFSKSSKILWNKFFESTEYTIIFWRPQVQGIISMILAYFAQLYSTPKRFPGRYNLYGFIAIFSWFPKVSISCNVLMRSIETIYKWTY